MGRRTPAGKKPNVGMVIAIPLPDGKFAFAKIFHDIVYGVYDLVSDAPLPMEQVVPHRFSFFLYGNGDQAIQSGLWPILGEDPFPSQEDAFAPPVATLYDWDNDTWYMGGKPWIIDRNGKRNATRKEVEGLDFLTVDPSPQAMVRTIVHRLVHGNHHEYKVRSK